MQQVLFWIPFKIAGGLPNGIPIYGFAMMLLLAFGMCLWLGGRLAQRDGIRKEHIQDLAMWLFVGGILGARFAFLYLEGGSFWDFFRIWEGGLVFYGSAIGGVVGYVFAYFFTIRKQGLSTWKLADIVAPCLALGLCVGRIGCLLNGCCYGGLACPHCLSVQFPLSGMPRFELVSKGYQTAAGFTRNVDAEDDRTVGFVDPTSAAALSGLRSGDIIIKARAPHSLGEIKMYRDLESFLVQNWVRGDNELALTVERNGKEVEIPAFRPKTLGLHPTQIYESISMGLVLLLLLAYLPFRKHAGEMIALWMFCYGLQRYLVELLRADPRPVGFEKYASVLLIVVGLALWLFLRRLPIPQAGLVKVAAVK